MPLCVRYSGGHRLDAHVINNLTPCFLHSELLLQENILNETPARHADTTPVSMSAIKGPGIEAEHEVVSADKKLELLGYDANLVFKDGENTVSFLLHIVTDATLTLSRT